MSEYTTSQHKLSNKVWSQLTEDKRKSNQLSSKAFFKNIKAQLSNIRTDVNKLVGNNRQSSNRSSTNTQNINLSHSKPTNGISFNKSFGSGSSNPMSTKARSFNLNSNISSMQPNIAHPQQSKIDRQTQSQLKADVDFVLYNIDPHTNHQLPSKPSIPNSQFDKQTTNSSQLTPQKSQKSQKQNKQLLKQQFQKQRLILKQQLLNTRIISDNYEKQNKRLESEIFNITNKLDKLVSVKNQQISRLVSKVYQLEKQINQANQYKQYLSENNVLRDQVSYKNTKIQSLSHQISDYQHKVHNLQKQTGQANKANQANQTNQYKQYVSQNNILREQIQNKNSKIQLFSKQINEYQHKVHQLEKQISHTNQSKLDQSQNNALRGQLQNRNSKIQLYSHQINQEQHRYQKLAEQFQLLKKSHQELSSANIKLKQTQRSKQYQIQLLKDQINTNKKQICQQNSNNPQSNVDFKLLGKQFEERVTQLIDQNYQLKNKITHIQNNIEQEKVANVSLRKIVEAFEQRDICSNNPQNYADNKRQNEEWEKKVFQLQNQFDKMQSEYQFQVMKLENVIDELKQTKHEIKSNSTNHTVNQMLKDQITEIQGLRTKLKEKNQIISRLKA